MPLTVELLDSPVGGQLDLIDVDLWEYTPGSGFSGSDAFSYRLFDGTDYSLPALVTFEQQPAAPSTPTTPTVTDVTETWLTGFEDEALGSVAVAVFETAEADVLDWTASIDWGDGITTTGQIVADGDGRFRVVGEHTYDDWGLYLVQVTLTDTAEATYDLYNLASIQFRNYTYTFTDPIGTTEPENSAEFFFVSAQIDSVRAKLVESWWNAAELEAVLKTFIETGVIVAGSATAVYVAQQIQILNILGTDAANVQKGENLDAVEKKLNEKADALRKELAKLATQKELFPGQKKAKETDIVKQLEYIRKALEQVKARKAGKDVGPNLPKEQ